MKEHFLFLAERKEWAQETAINGFLPDRRSNGPLPYGLILLAGKAVSHVPSIVAGIFSIKTSLWAEFIWRRHGIWVRKSECTTRSGPLSFTVSVRRKASI